MELYLRGVVEHNVAQVEASALTRPLVRLAIGGVTLVTMNSHLASEF
ncbi:MAG TPA: hypothetical protein VMV69_16760 [Pirellulales bacterium]|nr:hypothetical protein [Pirellulales bacterium]